MNQIELEREVLIRAVLNKDYEYILNKFFPLKRANLIGIPIDQHDDFMQEYDILIANLVDQFSDEITNTEK